MREASDGVAELILATVHEFQAIIQKGDDGIGAMRASEVEGEGVGLINMVKGNGGEESEELVEGGRGGGREGGEGLGTEVGVGGGVTEGDKIGGKGRRWRWRWRWGWRWRWRWRWRVVGRGLGRSAEKEEEQKGNGDGGSYEGNAAESKSAIAPALCRCGAHIDSDLGVLNP